MSASSTKGSLLTNLFSSSPSRQVPGLIVAENAVTPEEERDLLRYVDESKAPWTKRRTRITKNYGPYYLYTERNTEAGRFRYTDGVVRHTELPPFLYHTVLPIITRAIPLLQTFEPNQMHVALYRAKEDSKIHMHNDNKMGKLGPYIVGISLLSDCEMTFIRPRDNRKRVIKLPRRCVYVMSQESHFEWRHGILSGHTPKDRVSFTLRHVLKLACEEGSKIKKSAYTPSVESIQQQRSEDMLRSQGVKPKQSEHNITLTSLLSTDT